MLMPKESRLYKHIPIVEILKTISLYMIGVLLLAMVLTAVKYNPLYQSIIDRLKALLVIALVIFGIIYQAYSTPRIKVDKEGLLVEFLWYWLRIGWEGIDGIREVKSQIGSFRVWVVRSQKLTFFHRLYGLFTCGKFEPCFLVHQFMNNHLELIKEIEQYSTHQR